MKIIRRKESLLEIYLPQTVMRLVGLMFVLIGGTIATLTLASYTLFCHCGHQKPTQCQLITKRGFIFSTEQAIGRVFEAIVRQNTQKGSNYRLILHTSDGHFKLNSMPAPQQYPVEHAAQTINQYLQQCHKEPLTIPSLYPMWFIFFILIFPTTGIAILLFTASITLQFNKMTNQLTIQKKSFLKETQTHYKLDTIEGITIQESKNNKGQSMYRVALILKQGKPLPLTDVYDSLLPSKLKLAITINEFLNLKTDLSTWARHEKKQQKWAIILFIFGFIFILITLLWIR